MTLLKRPDLLMTARLTDSDRDYLTDWKRR